MAVCTVKKNSELVKENKQTKNKKTLKVLTEIITQFSKPHKRRNRF